MQLDEPAECASGGDQLLLIEFCIYRFSLWYIFFVHALRVEKNYQNGHDVGPLEIQFLRPRGCLINPFSTLLLCFRVIGKTPGLISHNNFVQKNFVCISHRDNVLAKRDSIFLLLMCQGVWNKTCTLLSLSQILFQNPKTYSLGDVQRFCYHFLCNSTVIFDQISNSSNVYLSSSRFWTATSLVIFHQLLSSSKSRIPTKNVQSVQSLIPMSLLHQY